MASNKIQPVSGMSDIDFPEVAQWQYMESSAREVLACYGLREVRTPILEKTEVFVRSIGDATDVVQKEMYTFEDRGGRSLTMRPEGTAGIIRYLASQGMATQGDNRIYYLGPMFRCERPQAGRKRQFHQCGVELIGEPCPAVDAECIALQIDLLKAWGLDDCRLFLNTRGGFDDQQRVREELVRQLHPRISVLCEECRRRIDTNVLRVMDCKQEQCRSVVADIPSFIEVMSATTRTYFDTVVEMLRSMGYSPEINPRLVRGLDYYEHTIWEITHSSLGAQDSLAGGGRYLIDLFGTRVAGVGFAVGLERVLMARSAVLEPEPAAPQVKVWLVSMGDEALKANMVLQRELRSRGISCAMDLRGRGVKTQMRSAHRSGAPYAVVRGDEELATGVYTLKDMQTGEQTRIDLDALLEMFA